MLSSKKLFSFIIITYKNFDGIYKTLDSLFRQDYPNIELIIADDGSPNYGEIADDIEKYIFANMGINITNVILRHFDVNRGTVCNINDAIAIAGGEYIKPLGCDDELATGDALSRYVSFMEQTNCNLVFAKLVGVNEMGEKVKYLASCEDDYDKLRKMSSEELCNRLYVRNCFPAPAWAGTKQLFERNGLFPTTGRLIEDYPYWIQLCQKGEQIGFMDDVLILYKLSGISSTGRYSEAFLDDMFKIYSKHVFPYDKRYGLLQPAYNQLKRLGLGAYLAKARWDRYSILNKFGAYLKYGFFFFFIKCSSIKMDIKNR